MKNVFALLASFILLAPAVLASPTAFPRGKDECIPVGVACGGDSYGKCCDGYECKDGGKGGHGHPELSVKVCCKVGHGGGH
ncbi:unnamed protein product [Rhizoctonia solani]|uniref:Uncharacterized protein n=1 Tax=Rhizoctonia solani TaxID=456999 RepID=A0A8H3GF36_9AGAM|nr:unnamed protein product [Rhizoctonia solani]